MEELRGHEAAAPLIAFLRAAIQDHTANVEAYAAKLLDEGGITVGGLEDLDDNDLVRARRRADARAPLSGRQPQRLCDRLTPPPRACRRNRSYRSSGTARMC